jgi:crotonobetainyl-CoA:carnitine CoA-transferase CaiB-like acyl-CoA transferase
VRVLELPALLADPGLRTNAGRLAARRRIIDAMSKRLAERPASEWIATLTQRGVPCGLVNTVLEALSSVEASPLTGIAPSVPGAVRFPPPRLDEHGEQIRREGWAAFKTDARTYPHDA